MDNNITAAIIGIVGGLILIYSIISKPKTISIKDYLENKGIEATVGLMLSLLSIYLIFKKK